MGQDLKHKRRDEAVAEQSDFFGFGIHRLFPPERGCYGAARLASTQVLCVASAGHEKLRQSAQRRPSGAREGGQPRRCMRSFAKRKRCAATQPAVSIMVRALATKSRAEGGRVKGTSAAASAAA